MKKRKKNVMGLKKWNKIVSILVKDKKKKGEKYDISQIRKDASRVYQSDFKKVPLSKIGKRKVVSKSKTTEKVRLKATDVAFKDFDFWFIDESQGDKFANWYLVGQWASKYANEFPEIPIMLIRKGKEPLVLKGATGSYSGSQFQKFVEEIREDLDDPNKSPFNLIDTDEPIGKFLGDVLEIDGVFYASWFEQGSKLPKVAPKITEIEPRKEIEIEKRKRKRKKEEKKPKKKTPRKKITLKKKTTKKTPLKKTDGRTKKAREEKSKVALAEKINQRIKQLEKRENKLIKLVEKGLLSKTEFKKQQKQISKDISEISKTKAKGGKI